MNRERDWDRAGKSRLRGSELVRWERETRKGVDSFGPHRELHNYHRTQRAQDVDGHSWWDKTLQYTIRTL